MRDVSGKVFDIEICDREGCAVFYDISARDTYEALERAYEQSKQEGYKWVEDWVAEVSWTDKCGENEECYCKAIYREWDLIDWGCCTEDQDYCP